jgi:hypothetical protein
LKQTAKDLIWWIVFGTAILSSIGGVIESGSVNGLMQGISIIVFGLLIMLITTVADWIKDKQFIWL